MQEYKRVISQAGGSPLGRRVAWQGIVLQWQASGLGVPAFCQQHGISAKRLYAWRARLGASGCAADGPAVAPSGPSGAGRPPVARFAQVVLESADAALEVQVGSARVLVRDRCDPGMLSTVLRVLKEGTC
jgi:hypothetical protein